MKTAAMMGTTFPQELRGNMEDTMVQLEGQLNTKKLQLDAGSGGSRG